MRGSGRTYVSPGDMEHSLGRWPQGATWASDDDLAAVLFDSGEAHARLALRRWASGELFQQIQAAISAGCAVELLAKSHLATIEPSLLSGDKADVDTLLHLNGKGYLAGSGPTHIKTLAATAAVLLVKRLTPGISYNPRIDDLVFRVRNAAAHMGIVDAAELRRAIGSMVRVSDSLVRVSKWGDRSQFWTADLVAAADAAVLDAKYDARARLEGKVAAATFRLRELLSNLTSETRSSIRATLANRAPWTSIDHDERAKCPVCGELGWLICVVDKERQDIDTGEGVYSVTVKRTAWPVVFNCNVCGIDLEEDELREVSEFPHSLELELDSEDWEPDEDYLDHLSGVDSRDSQE